MLEHQDLSKEVSKLIGAIQKEWIKELGETSSEETEKVIRLLRRLLVPKSNDDPEESRMHANFRADIESDWLEKHQWTIPHLIKIERLLEARGNTTNPALLAITTQE